MRTVDVGKEFSDSLTNRDSFQRDGRFTGVDFRESYLKELDGMEKWRDSEPYITLDFANVKRLGPSWANEVFAYFTKYAKPSHIFAKIIFIHITPVKRAIIEKEIDTGYSKK